MTSPVSGGSIIDLQSIRESRIRGRIVLTTKPSLFNHIDKIIESVMDLLKRKGLQNVRLVSSDWITFTGKKWGFLTIFFQRNRDLKDVIDEGAIRVCLEGSEIVGLYYAKTLKGLVTDLFIMAVFFISALVYWEDIFKQDYILGPLILFVLYTYGERYARITWFMKRELPKVINTAENVIEAVVNIGDTSSVEPQHRNLNPANLLRSAYFYRNNNLREKANAYLAYLVEKYPWTDEANAALEELKKYSVR